MELSIIADEAQQSRNLNDCYSKNIRDHFPFDEIRPAQELALQAIEEAYKTNKKFIIMELPCGIGKSGLGIAAASHAKTLPSSDYEHGAFCISPQKSLVVQYMKDFEARGLVELKGKSNYTCSYFTDEETLKPVDCETGMLRCTEKKRKMKEEMDEEEYERKKNFCHYCPYKVAKDRFIATPLGVTNFAYYLAETRFAGALPMRNLLIIDEAHNMENTILDCVSIDITYRRCQDIDLKTSIPRIKSGDSRKAVEWLNDVFIPHLNRKVEVLGYERDGMDLSESETTKITKRIKALESFRDSLDLFLEDPKFDTDWLVWTDDFPASPTFGDMTIKPLTARFFAHDLLFSKAQFVLIMSATIGDFPTFMRNLGIRQKDAICLRVESDFPLENRPIYYRPVGSMSSTKVTCPECDGDGCSKCYKSGSVKAIDVTLPKMVKKIPEILGHKNYADKQGIIHSHTYKVSKYLMEKMPIEASSRIITHENAKERDAAIAKHCDSSEPSILMSPSMGEGLDLKDDLSRFSIIVKTPFPFITEYVKARMARDPDWYAQQTVIALMQATGRSNRHNKDVAHHFILDSAFGYFVSKNEKMFPKYWLDSIIWPR